LAQKWQYVGKCTVPSDINAHIKQAWVTNLTNQQARIFAALQTKIASGANFTDRIATPAYARYSAFLATVGGGWDRDAILLKMNAKLSSAYSKWLANITTVFGSGGTFATIVNAKSAGISNVRRTIAVTGQKSFGKWSAATTAVLLLRGDTRPVTYFTADDSLTGTVEAAFDATKGALISPSLIAELVYGAVMMQYCSDANPPLTTLRTTIETAANLVLDDIMAAGLETAYAATTLHLAWDAGSSKVTVTATCNHT
jgi:hypothetical protein